MDERAGRPLAFLALTPLFAGLTPDALDAAATVAQPRRYAAGETMCRQGEPSDGLMILRRGVAQAFVEPVTGAALTQVARFRPGDVVGEIGLLAHVPRSATVVARSDGRAPTCRSRRCSAPARGATGTCATSSSRPAAAPERPRWAASRCSRIR